MKKLVFLWITGLVVVLDQVTKQWVTRNMQIGDSHPIIPRFLYMTYHRNSGAAWGILQGHMLLFYVVTVIAVIGISLWLKKLRIKEDRVLIIALVFILGGALGNFIDRVIYRAVIDFIHTVWWGYHFPIFNVADIALVCGTVLMLLDILILDHKKSKDLYFKVD
ncbi:MAG: signal peptidase II [Defluviitaleaceae bacterium]|nr:signal peptidase II [Defluviitaleaceae bacterium]